MKSRIFNVMQYVKHPDTGAELLNEDTVKLAVSHKTVTRYAYILHDKDKFFNDDEHADGEVKPPHWHIVIETKNNALDPVVIAKWLNIPVNFVDCPKGSGSFLDCVEYLTHSAPAQVALGKHVYNDNEVISNFNWREALDKRYSNKVKYGRDLDDRDVTLLDIQDNGLTLLQAYRRNTLVYAQNERLFKRARSTYLEHQPAPLLRMNFYIWSKRGGDGKGLASRALARQFYPGLEDEEIFFNVNADTMFNGYDGQPVIIWNDFRAVDLINACGGRGNVFDIFDVHPAKQLRNVKYATVALVNCINIINSIQPYTEFLDGLSGEYVDKFGYSFKAEDKSQAYRRFPVIVEIKLDSYRYLINQGYIDNEKTYTEYAAHDWIKGSFKALNETLSNYDALRKELETQTLKPLLQDTSDLYDRVSNGEVIDEAEMRSKFADYGSVMRKSADTMYKMAELSENLQADVELSADSKQLLDDYKNGKSDLPF